MSCMHVETWTTMLNEYIAAEKKTIIARTEITLNEQRYDGVCVCSSERVPLTVTHLQFWGWRKGA